MLQSRPGQSTPNYRLSCSFVHVLQLLRGLESTDQLQIYPLFGLGLNLPGMATLGRSFRFRHAAYTSRPNTFRLRLHYRTFPSHVIMVEILPEPLPARLKHLQSLALLTHTRWLFHGVQRTTQIHHWRHKRCSTKQLALTAPRSSAFNERTRIIHQPIVQWAMVT